MLNVKGWKSWEKWRNPSEISFDSSPPLRELPKGLSNRGFSFRASLETWLNSSEISIDSSPARRQFPMGLSNRSASLMASLYTELERIVEPVSILYRLTSIRTCWKSRQTYAGFQRKQCWNSFSESVQISVVDRRASSTREPTHISMQSLQC
jgi:hypothetical protein